MSKLDLTIIIPVHSVADENFRPFLDNALTSIANNAVKPEKVLIVRCACDDVAEELNAMDFSIYQDVDVEVVENTTGKSFQKQINFGAKATKTKYFSVLEFDDEISNKWLKNVEIYTKHYPSVKMFLPIITQVNVEGRMIGYANEAAWAKDFTEKLGVLDTEAILRYPNFNLSGMVVEKEAFLAVGGLKASIKLTFNYEFLLRFSHNANTIMVIPKVGYKHLMLRPGSLFWSYKNSQDESIKLEDGESQFWMDVATKEYFFSDDRNISYVKQTT